MTTMTEAELKILAEKAAEFLGEDNINKVAQRILKLTPPIELETLVIMLFEQWSASPILAHLGLREMIKRKFRVDMSFCPPHWDRALNFNWHFDKGNKEPDNNWVEGSGKDENYFIALWSAIMEAVGEK